MRVPTWEQEALQEQLRSALWGDDEQLAMTRLALSFPSLQGAAGIDPWRPRAFVTWVCASTLPSSGQHAARFVLEVWGPRADWRLVADHLALRGDRLGSFDVVEAMRQWDAVHRAAFVAWAAAPFFGCADAVARLPAQP
jgi:hypothetical protein